MKIKSCKNISTRYNLAGHRVQHIALATDDSLRTVAELRKRRRVSLCT